MIRSRILRLVTAFVCAVCLFGGRADAGDRRLLVINASDEPIYAVRIGNADEHKWGPDLLPFNDVIDVSRGREVHIRFDPTDCVHDLAATYHDGLVVVIRNVDICTTTQVSFRR
jgi:hypothetical protein